MSHLHPPVCSLCAPYIFLVCPLRAQVIQNLEGFPWLPDTELRDKCDQIFDIYDEDKDGFLNCKEIGKLALETGGGALPESEFVQVWLNQPPPHLPRPPLLTGNHQRLASCTVAQCARHYWPHISSVFATAGLSWGPRGTPANAL